MLAGLSPPPDLTVKTRDTSGNGVPVRIYTPEGAEGKSLPVGVYYHGGGYVLGNLDSEDALCRYIAKHTPCIIVSTDYRLAPEHKIPAILEDSVSAFKWVCFPYSPSRGFKGMVLNYTMTMLNHNFRLLKTRAQLEEIRSKSSRSEHQLVEDSPSQ